MTKTPFIIAGVAFIAFILTFTSLYAFVLQPFVLPDGNRFHTMEPYPTMTTPPTMNPSLTPDRNLVGTWKTSFATQFKIATDFVDGTLKDVGTQDRTVTWIVTEGENENVINVEVQFTTSNTQLVDGSGYTPDVSPMFLRGTISGATLTLQSSDTADDRIVGTFTYTNDIIQGTWDDHWTLVYEQEVYTVTNGLTLARQW